MAQQQFTAFWLGYAPSGGPNNGPLLENVPPYVDVLALAFANLFPGNTTCQQFLLTSNSEDKIRSGIAKLRVSAPHMKILLSLQGTPNPPIGWNNGITDPAQFGAWCANLAQKWGLDGFDVDNEDLDSFPEQPFVDAVMGMRAAMPNAILTMDTYLFDRDQAVIKQLAPHLTGINTMAYFLDTQSMKDLVEQYATVIEPGKISIGVKSDKVGPITQGTSVEETAALCQWNPSTGAKKGMMLWNVSQDIESITGQPDGTWTRTIHENMP
jgi:hypothetical protein